MRSIPILIYLAITIFYTLIDLYIYKNIKKTNKRFFNIRWSVVYLIQWIINVGLLVAILLYPIRDPHVSLSLDLWLIIIFISFFFSKIIYVLTDLLFKFFKYKHSATIATIFSILSFIYIWFSVIYIRNHIEVKEVNLHYSRLPKSFNNFKIAQISDLHLGTWGRDTTFVSHLVNRINALNPNLVVFTGDIVNRESGELQPFISVLSRFRAPLGVISVLGNHDYGDYINWTSSEEKLKNLEQLKKMQSQMGWKLLNNETIKLYLHNDSIAIIGVENWGEPPFKKYGDLTKAYIDCDKQQNLNDSIFKILLTHNPEHWRQQVVNISNIDLTLSGHTHAMQMIFPILGLNLTPASLKYKTWGGVYEQSQKGEPMRLIVNIGCGMVGLPIRLGSAYPEITLINLEHAE